MAERCDAGSWLAKNGPRIAAAGLALTRSENWGRRVDEGAWFDLQGTKFWGRVTFWPDGSADMEVLEVGSGLTRLSSPGTTLSESELEGWLMALEDQGVR